MDYGFEEVWGLMDDNFEVLGLCTIISKFWDYVRWFRWRFGTNVWYISKMFRVVMYDDLEGVSNVMDDDFEEVLGPMYDNFDVWDCVR